MTSNAGHGNASLWRAYQWELRKLTAQWRTYLGLAAMVAVPVAFVIAYQISPPTGSGEEDVALSVVVTQTGFALPLVVLFYTSLALQPLVTALVAGDIFATEDQVRTLKMILTRSTTRDSIFAAKVLATVTYSLVALLLFATTGLAGGGIAYGFHPVRLPGVSLSTHQAAMRVGAALGIYALPLLAVACLGLMLSVLAKNSSGAIVGTLIFSFVIQFLRFLPGIPTEVRSWLLTDQFAAWQTLFTPAFTPHMLVHPALVSVVYAVPPLVVAWWSFGHRDVIG